VVFRDGDVYGRTVNIASRIADQAEAGEVLTNRGSVDRMGDAEASFEEARTAELRGVAAPSRSYRVLPKIIK
jgi:class 3 adenylate cyclase